MYKVKIYENDICITVGTISKEQAIRMQDISTEKSNIYLDRLRQQYKEYIMAKNPSVIKIEGVYYSAMRLFCLDTQLVSFEEVEGMEYEVSSSFV